jgi:hypothetical protein
MSYSVPVHLSAPSGGSWAFTALCAAIFAGALLWSLLRAGRGDWLAFACLLGGLVACLIEAMLDQLGLLWYATNNHAILFHSFGVSMPLYVVLGYGFYFGSIGYFTLDALRQGKGSRFLWGIYVFGVLLDWALETTGGEIGLYRYYGPQPYRVLTEPLWWLLVNPALPIAAGGLFHLMRGRLRGWRALAILALLPMCYGATYGAIAWPIFVAFHSRVAHWVIWVAGAVTDAFALSYVALVIAGLDWHRRRTAPAPVTAAAEATLPRANLPSPAQEPEPLAPLRW